MITQQELICAKCGAVYLAPKMASRIRYWMCRRRNNGRKCGGYNVEPPRPNDKINDDGEEEYGDEEE